jgi:hypothetical protein
MTIEKSTPHQLTVSFTTGHRFRSGFRRRFFIVVGNMSLLLFLAASAMPTSQWENNL